MGRELMEIAKEQDPGPTGRIRREYQDHPRQRSTNFGKGKRRTYGRGRQTWKHGWKHRWNHGCES